MCAYCKTQKYEPATRTHTVTLDNNIIVILNVPCFMCSSCGETFYSDEVTEKLEKIVTKAGEMLSTVNIVDYRKIA